MNYDRLLSMGEVSGGGIDSRFGPVLYIEHGGSAKALEVEGLLLMLGMTRSEIPNATRYSFDYHTPEGDLIAWRTKKFFRIWIDLLPEEYRQ